jgi:hypothetical protein
LMKDYPAMDVVARCAALKISRSTYYRLKLNEGARQVER